MRDRLSSAISVESSDPGNHTPTRQMILKPSMRRAQKRWAYANAFATERCNLPGDHCGSFWVRAFVWVDSEQIVKQDVECERVIREQGFKIIIKSYIRKSERQLESIERGVEMLYSPQLYDWFKFVPDCSSVPVSRETN